MAEQEKAENANGDEPTYGSRFLTAFRESTGRVDWNYETLQRIKACDCEQFVKIMSKGNNLSYQTIQRIRRSTPEEFAEWLINAQQQARNAAVMPAMMLFYSG